ncbi:Acetyl-coenzyme A synthetase [compost metagenome]
MSSRSMFLSARDFLRERGSDYDGAVANFEWPRQDEFNWALDYFDPMAWNNPRTALLIAHEDGSLEATRFDRLARRSNQVANFLRRLGVRRGDRLLMMLPNVTPLWEVLLACMKLGAVVIPATTLLNREELADRFERGLVKYALTDPEGAAKLAPVLGDRPCIVTGPLTEGPEGQGPADMLSYAEADQEAETFTPEGPTRADDPLLLYFTSGTTAKPKLVMHTHQSYPVGHLSTMYWIGLREGDVHLNISSPGWAKHAWSCVFAPWNAEATVLVTNYARFDAVRVLALIEQAQVTTLCAPPTVWRMLIREDLSARSHRPRELVSAGEPLNPEVIEQVRAAWGLTIREGYGQTETTCQMGVSPGQEVRPGSMGRPMPGYRIVLLDPDDRETDEGEVAIALHSRPLAVMAGYADDPERTREALGGAYYRTGDVASRDADGYYWYVGRADDVFKSSDYRISPFELESVLIEHPAVVEAAVVPSPDPLRMAVPKAFVTLASGVEPGPALAREILRFTRERLAPYKRIRMVEFAELPKTISGKIRRVELRKQEEERRARAERGALEFMEADFPDLKA